MSSKGRVTPGRYFEPGNIAIAEGGLYAGLDAYYGYPITPSSEIMEHLAVRLPRVGGIFYQLEDEISSINASIGASWCRKKVMTATSGPGFSLMQEGIGLANWTETPLVVVNSQRLGPSTGMATSPGQGDLMQTRFGSHGDYINVVVAPGSVQECFDLTIQAFNISELLRTPVIILIDQQISSVHGTLIIPEKGEIPIHNRMNNDGSNGFPFKQVYPMTCFGEGKSVFSTGLTHQPDGTPDLHGITHEEHLKRLFHKIEENSHIFPEAECYRVEDADFLIVAYGSAAWTSYEAVDQARQIGMKVGLFRPRTLWPFPSQTFNSISNNISHVLTVELSFPGQLSWLISHYSEKKLQVSHFPNIRGRLPYISEVLTYLKRLEG